METKNCCEVFQCNKTECPAYRSDNQACWLISGTCCKDAIQGKFIDKMEMCIDCVVFEKNIATTSLKETFTHNRKMIKRLRETIFSRDELEIEITERKKLEMERQEREAFISTILEASSVGILTYKATGECVSANESVAKIVGATVDNLLKQNFYHIESWKKSGMLELAEEALAQGIEKREVFHFVSTFGKESWCSWFFIPFKFNNEIHLLALLTDISERIRAEEKLKENEERYRILFNNVSDAVFVQEISSDVYTPGRFIEVNDVACGYLGYSREELLQMSVPRIDAPETLANFPIILKRLFAEEHAMWEGN